MERGPGFSEGPCPPPERSVARGCCSPVGAAEGAGRASAERRDLALPCTSHGTRSPRVWRRCTSPEARAVPAFLAGLEEEGSQRHGGSPMSILGLPHPPCLHSLQEHNRTAKQMLRNSGSPVFHIMLGLKAGFLHYILPDRYHEIHHSFRYGSRPLEDDLRGGL